MKGVLLCLFFLLLIISSCGHAGSSDGSDSSGANLFPVTNTRQALTVDESQYLTDVAEQSAQFARAFNDIGVLLQNYDYSDAWIVDVSVQIYLIRQACDAGMSLSPPSSLREIHNTYEQGLEHIYRYTELLIIGLDNFDADALIEAASELDKGTIYIQRTSTLITEFKENRY